VSNYVQSTNFATKDALSSGDPLKIVKGTEINTEFNNIATAVATKADLVSPTFTGTPALPTGTTAVTQTATDDTTKLATTAFVQDVAAAVKEALFPVGSIYTNATNSTNPGTLLGFGTWTAFAAGRVAVGFNASNALFDTAEETGGSADAITVSHTHTATVTDSGHRHELAANVSTGSVYPSTTVTSSNQIVANAWASNSESYILAGTSTDATIGRSSSETTGISVSNSTTGSSGTNANYQPYITVYMWKRTA
jgi:hypothetical protein